MYRFLVAVLVTRMHGDRSEWSHVATNTRSRRALLRQREMSIVAACVLLVALFSVPG